MIHLCNSLKKHDFLRHGFFEASAAQGHSLNAAAHVADRAGDLKTRHDFMVQKAMGDIQPLLTLKQVHGRRVFVQEGPLLPEIIPEADGVVTREKNIPLGIRTADCGALLFADTENHIIGACHAGWRGAEQGVIKSTVLAMEKLGANRRTISASLGPLIFQKDYEVGPEFPDIIFKQDGDYETFFKKSSKEDHHLFDLPLYIIRLLEDENLQSINSLDLNTFRGNFFSRRKALAKREKPQGRCNLSIIAMV